MDQETAVNKVMAEIKKDWYVLSIFENMLRPYLMQLFAVGFNKGMLHSTEHMRKAVDQFNKLGQKIGHYDSINEAARVTGFDVSSIHKAISGKLSSAYGYYWKKTEV